MKTLIFPSEPEVAHAEEAGGAGMTLCGLALEGECAPGCASDDAYTRAGRVSCPTCIAIIEHCRAMPQTWKAPKP